MFVFFVLLILSFTAAGLDRVLRSLRGRPVACDPVCARCGYDLRGFAERGRCSECGSDLLVSGAVRRTTQRTSRRGVIGGLALAAVPWAFIGGMRGLEYLGPNWERVRSNRSLVTAMNEGGNFGPYPWNELARRVATGRMSREETAGAMDAFAVYVAREQRRPMGTGFSWGIPFYQAADRAGVIDAAHYLTIAQAVYGREPRVRIDEVLPADAPSGYWLNAEHAADDLPGAHLAMSVAQAYLTGMSATPEDLAAHARDAAAAGLPPRSVNILGPKPGRLVAPRVHSGNYAATFVVDMAVMPGVGQTRWTIGLPSGPTPLAQWRATMQVPVRVYREQGAGTVAHPARLPELVLRTDVGADPVMTRSLEVTSAEAWCYRDRTLVVFHLKVDHVPVPCWFKPVVRVAGQHAEGKWPVVIWPQEEDSVHGVRAECGPIGADVTAADLILIPATERRPGLEQVWGKIVKFEGVALTRHEVKDAGAAATTRP